MRFGIGRDSGGREDIKYLGRVRGVYSMRQGNWDVFLLRLWGGVGGKRHVCMCGDKGAGSGVMRMRMYMGDEEGDGDGVLRLGEFAA